MYVCSGCSTCTRGKICLQLIIICPFPQRIWWNNFQAATCLSSPPSTEVAHMRPVPKFAELALTQLTACQKDRCARTCPLELHTCATHCSSAVLHCTGPRMRTAREWTGRKNTRTSHSCPVLTSPALQVYMQYYIVHMLYVQCPAACTESCSAEIHYFYHPFEPRSAPKRGFPSSKETIQCTCLSNTTWRLIVTVMKRKDHYHDEIRDN